MEKLPLRFWWFPGYTYSIDGITYGNSPIFSNLSAGTYTIYYRDTNGCDTSETITLNNPPDLSGVISITSQVSCFLEFVMEY